MRPAKEPNSRAPIHLRDVRDADQGVRGAGTGLELRLRALRGRLRVDRAVPTGQRCQSFQFGAVALRHDRVIDTHRVLAERKTRLVHIEHDRLCAADLREFDRR